MCRSALRPFTLLPSSDSLRSSGLELAPLVSICIPTYKRAELLATALESCLIQDYEPLEIVVGDDSPDDRSAAIVADFAGRRDWHVSYRHNVPALGQNANVAGLFSRARGSRLILLHDDDVLLPGAVSALAAPWGDHPDLALTFGKQEILADGTPDAAATKRLNADFFRTGVCGLLDNSLRAALLQQMPNDGYMIRADLARDVGYRSEAEVGVLCDLDFTLRLGALLGGRRMFLLERHVSQYRLTSGSISNAPANRRAVNPLSAKALFSTLESLPIPAALQREKRMLLDRFIESMVKGFAISGERRTAIRLFLSSTYGWRRRLSPKGFYHALLIVDSRWDRFRRYD